VTFRAWVSNVQQQDPRTPLLVCDPSLAAVLPFQFSFEIDEDIRAAIEALVTAEAQDGQNDRLSAVRRDERPACRGTDAR
jgi:hypothetical protein